MPTKVTFAFNQDRSGFSETHWLDGTNIDAALVTAQKMAVLAAACRSPLCKLDYYRVTTYDADNKKLKTAKRKAPANAVSGYGTNTVAIQATLGAKVVFPTEDGVDKRYTLRGIPRSVIQDAVGKGDDIGVFPLAESYIRNLELENFGTMILGDTTKYQIEAITVAGDFATVKTFEPHGMDQAGGFVRFYDVNICGWPGRAKVVAIVSVVEFKVIPCCLVGTYKPPAEVKVEDMIFSRYGEGYIDGAGQRKAGRPFGLSRGKTSSTNCCTKCH